jgi:HK97 family phage prohead protease
MTTATTPEERSARAKILDVREQRRLARPLEYRTDTKTGQVLLEGYAATFTPYDVYGGVEAGGWVEEIDARAFDRTLGTEPDVQLLLNHEGLPLARTKHGSHPGTLLLHTDRYGLRVQATLDQTDPDVQRLMPKMRRGDMDEMSFAFRVHDQSWDTNYTHRRIKDINLEKGDVSVVNYGMNPNTAAMLSSANAIDVLAKLSNTDMLELRNLDRDRVRRALAVLERAAVPKSNKGLATFADPGYKDADYKPAKSGNGVPRYPLNSAARVQSAWRHISTPKNRKDYTAEQIAAIERKIKSAAKKFGVELSTDSKPVNVLRIETAANAAGGTMLVAVLSNGSKVPVTDNRGGFGSPYTCTPSTSPLDPHEEPYSKGAQTGSVPGDRPNLDVGSTIKSDSDTGPEDSYMPMPKQLNAMGVDDECDPTVGDLGPDVGEHVHGDEQDRADDDDQDDEERDEVPSGEDRPLDLGKVVALEHTIVTCYDMAADDLDMRAMLARARRQVRDLQGIPEKQVDVSRKLEELRSEFGDPETISVADGLRAISQMGFTDTVRLSPTQ